MKMGPKSKKARSKPIRSLYNPHEYTCPRLGEEASECIRSGIKEFLGAVKDDKGEEEKVTTEDRQARRKTVLFGFNEVCRAVKNQKVHLVLVSDDIKPRVMQQQLLILCRMKNIRLVAISKLELATSSTVGVKRVIAMAFKNGQRLSDPLVNQIRTYINASSDQTYKPDSNYVLPVVRQK